MPSDPPFIYSVRLLPVSSFHWTRGGSRGNTETHRAGDHLYTFLHKSNLEIQISQANVYSVREEAGIPTDHMWGSSKLRSALSIICPLIMEYNIFRYAYADVTQFYKPLLPPVCRPS